MMHFACKWLKSHKIHIVVVSRKSVTEYKARVHVFCPQQGKKKNRFAIAISYLLMGNNFSDWNWYYKYIFIAKFIT